MRRERQRASGVVLFRQNGEREYLLLRSALTRRTVWEFPKGGIEEGETEVVAAERELREETGLREGDFEFRSDFREEENYVFTRGGGSERWLIVKSVVYFLAEWKSGEVQISHESTDFRWVPYDEARRLVRFPEKRRVLERADRLLGGTPPGGSDPPRPPG
jgi:bis(5'-nucleosidyl)-tetraphosphatase